MQIIQNSSMNVHDNWAANRFRIADGLNQMLLVSFVLQIAASTEEKPQRMWWWFFFFCMPIFCTRNHHRRRHRRRRRCRATCEWPSPGVDAKITDCVRMCEKIRMKLKICYNFSLPTAQHYLFRFSYGFGVYTWKKKLLSHTDTEKYSFCCSSNHQTFHVFYFSGSIYIWLGAVFHMCGGWSLQFDRLTFGHRSMAE